MALSIAQKILDLENHIAVLEQKYARERDSVQLIAVSKSQGWEKIAAAYACGQHVFGENYLQEATDKMDFLEGTNISWHFIGPIQSNKTRDIARCFSWVHTIDREKIVRRLSEQRPEELEPLNLLIQVNISGESSKSGVEPDAAAALAHTIDELPGLKLRGLMAIPAPEPDFEKQRASFLQLAQLRDQLVSSGFPQCKELSMGMSRDYEAAIAAGATMIRIGTDIFGAREK